MHILYLHQYFATPRGNTGTRSYEFAKRWAAAGHRVTMLTTVAQLTETDLIRAKRGLITHLQIDGINLMVCNIRYRQAMGFVRRVWTFFGFMLLATWLVLRVKDVDMVYATSTPLTVGVPALIARRLRGRRYVFEVRDEWPAVPIDMGIIRNRFVIAVLRRVERMIYCGAEAIVALSPGMAEGVRAVAPSRTRIETIPNCADTQLFRPEVDGDPVRRTRGWDGRFVCLHAGAMGRANGLDLILRAARHFRDVPDFLFVLAGEGSEKPKLQRACDELELENLQIVDAVPKSDLPAVIAACDLCLVTFANVPILEHNSANKFFDSLSAGKPVVLNYGGWQREVLESAGAGLGCAMGDEAAFFANLTALQADEARRAEMGRNARRLALGRYNRDLLAAQVLKVIIEAARDYPMLRRSDRI